MNAFSVAWATFFGVGKLPLAPGTWASAVAVPLFWFLMPTPIFHALVLALLMGFGVPVCTRAEKVAGERDPGSVVLDEVLGMGVALWAVPREPHFILMAFILFRLFDIWKPYPIRKLQDLPGGWGIMVDDLLAGIYANGLIKVGVFVVMQIA